MLDSQGLRILLVTRNLPPLVGGMERLNWHMADELSKAADVRVIGPSGSAAMAPAGVIVREARLQPLWRFLLQARMLARREARAWKPDIMLAGSGLTAPIARSAARLCGAKTCVYVHGLDVAVRHPVYRAIWLRAIRSADRVIANSHATAELCRSVGVDPARIAIVHPGVDLPVEAADKVEQGSEPSSRRKPGSSAFASSLVVSGGAARFRQAHRLGDRPLLLSVGRLSTRKGLREFVSHVLPRIVAARPKALLLVVGDAPRQALHAEAQTPESIRAAARVAGVDGHLLFLGTITDYAKLGAIYRASDVHIFPVRDIPGDPEGFGMVAVEAAAHGLPSVAFATGGIVDAVAEGRSGYLVPPGDYAALSDAIIAALAERESLRSSCVEFARRFAWPEFGMQLQHHLHSIMSATSTSSPR
ncbi:MULTISPECIES: glycosyltransferase family 4 protein [Rhodanobacter]|uniref:glycosyltransferase family 4 protein n=1 Tax=Rhodanobacter TaxID=75309 RepID=UPI00047FA968|nr:MULTISPECIES: glycosyltransferase family 4 protein [Rhodanobacter]KZC19686.1 glycosyl transferase [Rhodanobacter denitrificans]UJJ51971.1 glycosyltransferase family 4 protein [Rhodanobacter denitrificans]UJM94715.1 glycosyltransferase family 4 protein [Rhodanobacter denitrificans]UJM98245.1 glycosyltransferase family 4 protein [Rhodanobacter denitrificans]UJN22342.1 glycosyltransferase family 4 protein [Rhodanobacter denitrificans]